MNTNDVDVLGTVKESFSHPGFSFTWVMRNRIVCKDGFSISVQVGHSLYCLPQDDHGPWTHVELGFPNHSIGRPFREYREEDPKRDAQYERWVRHIKRPGRKSQQKKYDRSTMFSYVPVELVAKLIARHGGRVE